jgi:hypothetical protein
VTLASGLDFKRKLSFSSATLPPPTTRICKFLVFKKIGYKLFVFRKRLFLDKTRY